MRLDELFQDDDDPEPVETLDAKNGMRAKLRQAALDLITPMLGQNLPFVTIKQIIDGLSNARFGIVITPALVMDILNPDEVKAIDKIEGDRVYLSKPGAPEHEVDQDQQEQDKTHVADMATDQINKELQQK